MALALAASLMVGHPNQVVDILAMRFRPRNECFKSTSQSMISNTPLGREVWGEGTGCDEWGERWAVLEGGGEGVGWQQARGGDCIGLM